MSEHEPQPRLTDEQRIIRAISEYRDRGSQGVLDDTTARMIANQFHEGQTSALYSFMSTGRIDLESLRSEILRCYLESAGNELIQEELEVLSLYVYETGNREAVEGWHERTQWDRGDE